jgi:hypothetical protein
MSSVAISAVTISAAIRQNAWGKFEDSFHTIKTSKKIHCPWGHTKSDVDEYSKNPAGFNKYQAVHFTRLSINTFAVIAEKENETVLLVRLTSQPRIGVMEHLKIIRKPRNCGHILTRPGEKSVDACKECEKSVVAVCDINKITKDELLQYWKEGCVMEDFHTIYRDVEVIGEINLLSVEAGEIRNYVKRGFLNSIKTTSIDIPKNLIE